MAPVVASSVRGPSHERCGLPCQDAWLSARFRSAADGEASLVVVCDGMGSRPRAREGARAATRAVRSGWRAWCRSQVGPVDDLIRYLEVDWRLRLGPIPASEAATTCLLFAEDGRGRAAVGQLGDGLIARRGVDGGVTCHPARSGGFGLTHALGTPHSLADWSFSETRPLGPGESLLLASDGVSEDLEESRIGALMGWVVDELAARPRPNRVLREELRRWPVPHHQDDKTLLVRWTS